MSEIANNLDKRKSDIGRELKMLRDRGQVLSKVEYRYVNYGRYGRGVAKREVLVYKFDERVLVGVSLKSYKRLIVLVVVGLALVYVMFSKKKVSVD